MIRHALGAFRASQIKADAAAQKLGLSRSRFYEPDSDYIKAYAHHEQDAWTPSVSGGDHAPEWPAPVQALLRKRLSSQPPASYSFAASEAMIRSFKIIHRLYCESWGLLSAYSSWRLSKDKFCSQSLLGCIQLKLCGFKGIRFREVLCHSFTCLRSRP